MMARKVFRRIIQVIVALICAAILVVGIGFVCDLFKVDTTNIIYESRDDLESDKPSDTEIAEHIVEPDQPRYMTIERLGIINARVIALGITGPNNQLQDPTNVHDVGWYYDSAKPGQANSTVPAGLYDGHNTGPYSRGVFYNLEALALGDEIIIERGDGTVFRYVVRESIVTPVSDVDMTIMMETATVGVEGLNIITCGGEWNEAANGYTHRVLIRAVLTSEES